MKILERIKKQTIIVCNYSYQKRILDEVNNDKNIYFIKFFSMNEFISHYYFSYDDKTIAYLIKKYGYSYDIAVTYLKNLIYVNDNSSYFQLQFLYDLKNELIANNLLYFDEDFKSILKDFDILFVGIPYFKRLEEVMIRELKSITNVNIYNDVCVNNISFVNEASTIDEEVSFVASRISKLLSEGISIDKIKLANVDSDYLSVITKVFSLYDIPVNVNKHYLYSLNIAKDFLVLMIENSIDDVMDILFKKYKRHEELLKMVVDIVNKYVLIDDKDIKKEFIIHDFKNTLVQPVILNAVNVIDYLSDSIATDDIVFLLNFNQNAIPSVRKDEDYITDVMKDGLNLDLVSSLNKKIKDATVKRILSIPNLVITYKLQTPYRSFYPANLINDMNLEVKKISFDNVCYSKRANKIDLASMLNKFITYGVMSEKLALYYHNFDIDYMSYDNKFKGVSDNYDKNGDVVLSYSTMNDYYLCGFKYYVSKILKLDIYEDTFAIYIGNLFHFVLQHHFMERKDVDCLINEYVSLNPLKDARGKFFVRHLRGELHFIVNAIKEQMKECSLDQAMYEKRIEVNLSGNTKIIFKGFIDKLLYHDYGDKCIVAIIDYKTGNTSIDMSLLSYGLSMQLPVYLYLAKNSDLKNITFAGFYLQKILHEVPSIDIKTSFDELKKKELRLSGYSNYNEDVIHEFDHSYKDSRVIKSMKVKNDGTYSSYAKVLTDDELSSVIDLVHEKIINAGNSISDGKFDINPKEIDGVNVSCTYCKVRDICFRSNKDIKKLEVN